MDSFAIDWLITNGVSVVIEGRPSGRFWHCYCDWDVFLRAMWHAWAEISRGSVRTGLMYIKRIASVTLDGRVYYVGYRMTKGGIVYGSLAI